jgi:hypothetical protein
VILIIDDATVVQADDVAGDGQLRHAKDQLTLANRYPGHERSMPSGANVIEPDAVKHRPRPKFLKWSIVRHSEKKTTPAFDRGREVRAWL